MKTLRKISIIIFVLLTLLSCSSRESNKLTSKDIPEVVEGLSSNKPLEKYSLVDADEKLRAEFREELSRKISDNRDASACALFSRIDEATDVTDEIVDGDYIVTLIWNKGGIETGEELIRKVFRQDGETLKWYQKTMDPYHSGSEYRYSVTELSFNGDILPEANKLIGESGLELPDIGKLDTVSYSYNEIIRKVDNLRTINSPVVMLTFTLGDTELDKANAYVKKVSERKGSSTLTRAGVIEDKLNIMLMKMN